MSAFMDDSFLEDRHDSIVHIPRDLPVSSEIVGNSEVKFLFINSNSAIYKTIFTFIKDFAFLFLTPKEIEILKGFSVDKRRVEWVMGRICIKSLLLHCMGWKQGFHRIEILKGESGEPLVVLKQNGFKIYQPSYFVSLSHRNGSCVSALSKNPVGIDLEIAENLDNSMMEDYFDCREKDLLDSLPSHLVNFNIPLGWSMKESVLKVLKLGLSVSPKSVTIESIDPDYMTALLKYEHQQEFECKFIIEHPYIISISSMR